MINTRKVRVWVCLQWSNFHAEFNKNPPIVSKDVNFGDRLSTVNMDVVQQVSLSCNASKSISYILRRVMFCKAKGQRRNQK
jgi:spore coat protein U-like protein